MKHTTVGMPRLFMFIAVAVIIVGGTAVSESAPGGKILIVAADFPGGPPVSQLRATDLFDEVQEFDATDNTPTLDFLKTFKAVLAYTNKVSTVAVALGNVLADYVDTGGRVVLATFAYSSVPSDFSIKGRITTTGFSPLVVGTISDVNGQLEAEDANDPIFAGPVPGVQRINLTAVTYFHSDRFANAELDVAGRATLLATAPLLDANGVVIKRINMIARNSRGNVIGVNLFPAISASNNTEFYRLLANTLIKPARADLTVTKTASPDIGEVGSDLTYTLAVTNKGPDPATGVILTDTLPTEVTLKSATPTQGSCSGTSTVTCNLGEINTGPSATVTIVVTPVVARTPPATITNTASITKTDVLDPVTTNNSATVSTVVWSRFFTDGTNSLGVNSSTGDFTLTFVVGGQPQLCSGTLPPLEGSFLTLALSCTKGSGDTIQIRAVGALNGILTVELIDIGPTSSDRVIRRFALSRLALSKLLPKLTLTLTGGTSYRTGDPLTLKARLTNPGSADAPLELKLLVLGPEGILIDLIELVFGRRVAFTLKASADITATVPPFDNLPLPAGVPLGPWQFQGALLETVTGLGLPLSRSTASFDVLP